jgi:stage II sporulation protein M
MAVLAPVSLGVLAGLLTLVNGFVVGYVGAIFAGWSRLGFFACGVAPHGIIEIPALVLASGFALRLGATMVRPAPDGWLRGMGLAAADYARGLVVVVPMFGVAAGIEAFVTQSCCSTAEPRAGGVETRLLH